MEIDLPVAPPVMRRQISDVGYFKSKSSVIVRKCMKIFAPGKGNLKTTTQDDGKAKCSALAVVRTLATAVPVSVNLMKVSILFDHKLTGRITK
jgi:hypothetical protein